MTLNTFQILILEKKSAAQTCTIKYHCLFEKFYIIGCDSFFYKIYFLFIEVVKNAIQKWLHIDF